MSRICNTLGSLYEFELFSDFLTYQDAAVHKRRAITA